MERDAQVLNLAYIVVTSTLRSTTQPAERMACATIMNEGGYARNDWSYAKRLRPATVLDAHKNMGAPRCDEL
jgi:hypothetical protein